MKIFLLAVLFLSSLCASQIPGLINYSEEDGLNSSYTYEMNEDKNGFIWIGSDNGLFRFDGKEFRQYNKKEGLKNIDILSCEPLSGGEVFIMPFLNDFAYLKNNVVINSDINRELKKIRFEHNPFINTYQDSVILCNNNNPKKLYVFKDEKVTEIPLYIKYSGNDPDNKLIPTSYDFRTDMLYLSDEKTGRIVVYDIRNKKEYGSNISLPGSLWKKDNFLIRIQHKELNIYEYKDQLRLKKKQTIHLEDEIHRVLIDKNNKLWIYSKNGGVFYFDEALSSGKKLQAPKKILQDYIINDILVDTDNNVWFSTRNNGIFFITEKFFRNYITLPIKNNSASITAISGNSKAVFLGYNEAIGGIFCANKITDIVFEKNKKNENSNIFATDKKVFFGLVQNVYQYDILTRKKKFLGTYNLKNLLPFTDSSIFICSSEGLTVYDFKKDLYTDFLKNERVYTALPFSKDSLFVGDFKNLYTFSIATKKKKLFLEGYYFKDIKKLKSNVYIGATNLNGIVIFNNRKVIKHITEHESLPSNQVKRIDIENENTFWASTNSGLCRIEYTGNTVHLNNFTKIDGLPGNRVSGCVIKKDTIYIATSKGLGILSVRKLLMQQKVIHKKVILNSITIGGKILYDFSKKPVIQSLDNDLVFSLSFPDYASLGKISYRYKIEGLNEKWQISNSSKIILNALPPGKYVFKVFGLGYNGKQSYTSTEIPFEIKPKYWQTWWFTVLLIILSIVVILAFLTYYFQKKRNKKLKNLFYDKKIAELELQAIKAQINPHFIYNCLNSIQYLLYKKDYPETENYLDVFSQMIRKTLHYSEKTFMPVNEEVEYLSLYLNMEKLRLKDQFDYEIVISKAVNPEWLIPSLLIQPFVENAIKHGIANLKDRKGNIKISFDVEDTSLCICIEDNGIGIQNENDRIQKDHSFGVKLSRKRIETFRQLFETDIILEIHNLSERQQRSGTQIKLYMTPYEKTNTSLYH
ncbi:histidine kinase [Chryseobacterium sp. GMJ5]|uniref:Histidine kinase n=1 Tax=Chryseobacterium gilvum TaxID=2976534 RepID=A0ABT2VV57_9FLAO|nr:histidine kinase [Chryseobacterium gilvum]MCU7613884.1 histidine kinase [Chryseobacterium gilvum]